MAKGKAPQLATFQQCTVCHGKRFVKNVQPCTECQALGNYLNWNNNFLYWDYGLSGLHIVLRRVKYVINTVVNGLLILVLIADIIVLVRLSSQYDFDTVATAYALFIGASGIAGIFWILLFIVLFMEYRLFRASISKQNIIDTRQRQTKKGQKINIALRLESAAAKIMDEVWVNVNQEQRFPIRPIHIFYDLLKDKDIQLILSRLGLPINGIADSVAKQIGQLASEPSDGTLSHAVRDIFLNAYMYAYDDRSRRIRTTDIFLATVYTDAVLQDILYDRSITPEMLANAVHWINFNNELTTRYQRYRGKAVYKPKGPINRSYTAAATPFLDSFSTDLTQLARAGRLPLAVARDNELEEIFRVMAGGGRSIVLVGDRGVGKETIIHGLANRMTAEEVPPLFADKRLVSLSLSSLVAGATQTGEVQERLLHVIGEVVRSGNIILVISDLHNLVGIASEGTANIDLSEILAQELGNYNQLVIATTTPQDFTTYIERGPLAKVFERIRVPEPERNDAILILEANVGKQEIAHRVYFTYQALEKLVDLSDRYLHDQFLPAKALSLMAEAASWVAARENNIVLPEDIAALVSHKTKIPLTNISSKESQALLNLDATIHKRIIGQEEAVQAVVAALRRARAELRDEKRPIVNLLFLGPTGVGKTELSKAVAASYFGEEGAMIRLDMSEYQHRDSISRMLGTAGDKQGGVLTEAVRKQPFALLLLDEIEKAHPEILNLFLQVMDDGRLTDAKGSTVDFTNVILIATSNANANYIQDSILKKIPIDEIKNVMIRDKLREHFRPEFLNRFDSIVLFKPLSEEEIFQIAGLLLKKVESRLEEKGITLKVTEAAQAELARAGFDPIFGARPLRRVIQEQVDNALANYLLKGAIDRRDEVLLDAGGKITVTKAEKL